MGASTIYSKLGDIELRTVPIHFYDGAFQMGDRSTENSLNFQIQAQENIENC